MLKVHWKPLTIFTKSFILDLWLASQYSYGIPKVKCILKVQVTLYTKMKVKISTCTKMKRNYCKTGVVSCKTMRKCFEKQLLLILYVLLNTIIYDIRHRQYTLINQYFCSWSLWYPFLSSLNRQVLPTPNPCK